MTSAAAEITPGFVGGGGVGAADEIPDDPASAFRLRESLLSVLPFARGLISFSRRVCVVA